MTMRVVDRNNKLLCDSADYLHIPHVIKAKERQPLTADEENRLAYELGFIRDAVTELGLCKQEKKILSEFFNGRLINHQSFAINMYQSKLHKGAGR